MRNKRAEITKQNEHSVINPIKKNVNLKDTEQLRRKLKGLFEKDPKNRHLLASGKKIVQGAPIVVNEVLKTIVDENVSINKKGIQVNKTNPVKSKDQKQNNLNVNKSNQNSKIGGAPLKRKLQGNLEHQKKATKTSVSCHNGKSVKKQETHRPPRMVPNVAHKTTEKREIQWNTSKENTDSSKQIKNNRMPRNDNKSIQLVPKKKSTEKAKLKNVKKVPKPQEINVKLYRGPLRPETSEADSDSSSDRKEKNPTLQKVFNEQALTRASCKKEEESSDHSYDDQDFDSTSTDDSNDFSSYSDESTEYDDDSIEYHDEPYSLDGTSSDDYIYDSSDSDQTYELPENVAEDVYIANGMAVKHDLLENTDVGFDSETSSTQIIEIHTEPKTQQAVTNSSTVLTKANSNIVHYSTHCADSKACESDNSCPELVPIDYKSDLYDDADSDSDGCSDCFSFSGSDASTGSFSEASNDSGKQPEMTPEIFQADKTTKQDFGLDFLYKASAAFCNNSIHSPLERITNSKGNASSYKIITTNNEVVNPELIFKETPKQINTQTEKQFLADVNRCQNEVISSKCDALSTTITTIVTETDEIQSNDSFVKRSIDTTTACTTNPFNKETEANLKKTSQTNSSFRTLFFNAINSNHVIVLLRDPLYIYGTVKFKLFAGSVNIFGYNPKQHEILEIFSPRGYSLLKIETSRNSAVNVPVNKKELLSLTPYFIRTDLEEIFEKFDAKKDAIVILERNDRSKKVNMLRKYMVEHLFPNMNSLLSDRPFYTSEFLLRCIITPRSDKALIVDPRWRSITLTDNSRVMVIGGKSVGKSTLVRYLINKHLNKYPKILLIDLDIGQPEMFVPQTISVTTLTTPLLGPGYFLNREPDKAFLVGQTNVVLLPQRYIESVQALMEYCKMNNQYRDIPWIVNTMGYNKGFGDELIAVICNLLHPTNIVQLESNREINNFDVIMSKENLESLEFNIIGDMFSSGTVFRPNHHLTLLTSVIPSDKKHKIAWDMNPRDMRLAMIISRLSTILRGHAEWLMDIKPVCASIDDLKIINLGDDQINTEDLLKTLVGNLIYLCQQNSSQPNECLGIGIVRGVDYPLKQIYLLPAVPLEVLEKVNCLAVCGIPLPSSILINQGPKVKGVAPYVYNTIDKAASMHIKQIYHRPQHFLTGRHKSVVE